MEVTKEKMGIFLRDVFKQDPNPGALTVRQLRTKYLEHVKLEELDSKQLGMFSAVVDTIFQEFNDQQSDTNSEEEEDTDTYPRSKAAKSKKRKPNDDSTDEDDDFKPNNRKSATSKAKQSSRTRKRVRKDESLSSDDAKDESLSSDDDFKPNKSSRSSKVLKKKVDTEPSESSSDGLPLTALKNVKDSEEVDELEVKDVCKNELSGQEGNSEESNASTPTIPYVKCTADDKEKSNTSENIPSDSSSDDENLLDLKHKLNSSMSSKTKSDTEEEKEMKTSVGKNMDSGSDSDKNNIVTSEDDSDDGGTKKNNRKVSKKKASKDVGGTREESKPSQKSKSHVSDDDDPQILRMKRFIRTAGLRVVYAKVFEGCRSKKAKVQKLVDVLEEAGLKGNPTLEKCKKLRKKRETMREVAELDQSNILKTTGRPRRNLQPGGFRPPSPAPVPREDSPPPVATKKIFSRLKDIVDSEESD